MQLKKHYFSKACSIDLGDRVMVTGGQQSYYGRPEVLPRVLVYNTDGKVEKLHGFSTTDLSLNTARMFHACGHYFKDDKVVTISNLEI